MSVSFNSRFLEFEEDGNDLSYQEFLEFVCSKKNLPKPFYATMKLLDGFGATVVYSGGLAAAHSAISEEMAREEAAFKAISSLASQFLKNKKFDPGTGHKDLDCSKIFKEDLITKSDHKTCNPIAVTYSVDKPKLDMQKSTDESSTATIIVSEDEKEMRDIKLQSSKMSPKPVLVVSEDEFEIGHIDEKLSDKALPKALKCTSIITRNKKQSTQNVNQISLLSDEESEEGHLKGDISTTDFSPPSSKRYVFNFNPIRTKSGPTGIHILQKCFDKFYTSWKVESYFFLVFTPRSLLRMGYCHHPTRTSVRKYVRLHNVVVLLDFFPF